MTYVLPSAGSVQVPAATAKLQTRFSRSPSRFPLRRYCGMLPVDLVVGLYAEFDPTEQARIRTLAQRANWPDGTPRPAGFNVKHEWRTYKTERSTEPFTLGGLTVQQAQAAQHLDTLTAHADTAATKAMTNATRAAEAVLTDPALMTNYATCNTATGGSDTIAGSTEAQGYINALYRYAVNQIVTNTMGAVAPNQICAVISRDVAETISRSPEYITYHKNYPQALAQLQRTENVGPYGLIQYPFGVETIVDDTVFVTSNPEATSLTTRQAFRSLGTVSTVAVNTPIVFIVKPAAPVAEPANLGPQDAGTAVNVPTHATIMQLKQEDMAYEVLHDQWNRLVQGAVTNNDDFVLTSVRSGFLVTDVLNE